MDNSIVPHQFNFKDYMFRAGTNDNGAPLFVAADVCKILEISNVSQALTRLDNDEKDDIILNDTIGRSQRMTAITESGLYSLILSSRKPDAKSFKRWITHEVLPQLRKTGSYSTNNLTPAEAFLQIAQQMVSHERSIAELQEHQAQHAIAIENINDRLEDADYFTVRQWCQKQRIKYTPSLLIMWGKSATALSRERNVERKEMIEDNYPSGRYHKSILFDVCIPKTSTNSQLVLLDE